MKGESGKTTSVWEYSENKLSLTPLKKDVEADVCIIGAGIAGLSTAYELSLANKNVVVIDDGIICGGETCRTSAHLSNVLDDGIFRMEKLHGLENAMLAVQSHGTAINEIESIVKKEGIDCGFERVDGYLFPSLRQSPNLIEEEYSASQRAGLKVERVTAAPIGFHTGEALRFPNQAQFNPLKYMVKMVEILTARGVQVYTQTSAQKIQGGDPVVVTTKDGFKISAGAAVVATNTPFNNLVVLHTKQAAYRTYVIGVEIPKGSLRKALFWDTEEPYHYVRTCPQEGEGGDILLVGGEDHRTGQEDHPNECFTRLEDWMRARFPLAQKILYRWSGQVLEPVDGLAFIGVNPLDGPNVYVTTGDSGMGITHGVIASLLLTDLILGRKNKWEHLYNPARKNLKSLGRFIKENLNTACQYKDWVTPGEVDSSEDIGNEEGAVCRKGLSKIAVYRDQDGLPHTYSAVCPHLGGIMHWNKTEKTWDCPCHGSRFNRYGKVINGPAMPNLAKVNV